MLRPLTVTLLATLVLAGCGGPPGGAVAAPNPSGTPVAGTRTAAPDTPGATPRATTGVTPAAAPRKASRPARTARPAFRAGNPAGRAAVPAAGRAARTSDPDHVIGRGTPSGCTSAAVLKAVAAGGVTVFRCGPRPVTITLSRTAKVVNARPDVVLDGGGLVTLSGGGARRILYLNTCDKAQGWTTSHCNDQAQPRLTVQNLRLADGDATGQRAEGGGGGAIFVRGGRLTVVNSLFVRNRCDGTGPDLGGAAIRVLDQAGGKPVHVVGSTFQSGTCSNGGALSSIGVSWRIVNSLFTGNRAVGRGANPARGGTPGGGSGGAIYADGNRFTISVTGTRIIRNTANEGGGAVFFVSNDRTGSLSIRSSSLRSNPSRGFETAGHPGIFFLGARLTD